MSGKFLTTMKLMLLATLPVCAVLAGCGARGSALTRMTTTPAPLSPAPATTTDAVAVADQLTPEESETNARPLRLPLKDAKVVVRKGARRVTLYSRGEAVRVYPAALGFEPEGDKVRQGDGRTPEGTFYVCMKNDRSRFYLSLGLSYPNDEDAERGLRDGLITRSQYNQIVRAIESKGRPPWNTPLGGEIFIHGGGTASDWTAGCVALSNEHIKELFDALPSGTTVVIER